MATSSAGAAAPATVTLVTQTRVASGQEAAFAAWQQHISDVVAGVPGFLGQTIIPPDPPAQVDWVILQRFARAEDALLWLRSEQRARLVADAQPMLVGPDATHMVPDREAADAPAPLSAVIATRVKPGQEAAFRRWEERIAAAQARAPGFQGYRCEPPIPSVQEHWVMILRFDSEPHLRAWLNSPERRRLLNEAAAFTEESNVRTVRTGFDQWFRTGGSPPPAWKQNMLVLLALYPVVFLFGAWVQAPLLTEWARMPFWLSLFVGKVASVLILSWVVPWVSHRFGWWLQPVGGNRRQTDLAGAAVVGVLYALCLLAFAFYP